jgi:protein-disulfide isomerase
MARNVLTGVLGLLLLVGLVDSVYLTWDHGSHKADPMGFSGGLCGADGGCEVSRSSALSEVPIPGTPLDMPVALLGLAFYLVMLVLVVLDHRQRPQAKDKRQATPLSRLLFGLSALSLVYSLTLFGYSIYVGSICKFCAILYVVNTGLLIVTAMSLGESLGAFFGHVWPALISRPAMVAAVLMVTFSAGGYLLYRGAVMSARAENEAKRLQSVPPGPADASRPTKGPADAKIKFIEFADFQCPHCKIAFKTLDDLAKERTDVSVTFLHFPLDMACNPLVDRPFHERACEFAVLAECAHRQGFFFETAAMLFDADEVPKDEILSRVAAIDPKIDRAKLESCINSDDALGAVKRDVQQGLTAEIRGTPSVFMNGKQIGGAVPRDELNRLISEIIGSAN